MGKRCTEQCHDAVAQDAVYSALVTIDGFDHALDHRMKKLLRILKVAIGDHLHRALDIGEKHGDLLSFALKRSLWWSGFCRRDAAGCNF